MRSVRTYCVFEVGRWPLRSNFVNQSSWNEAISCVLGYDERSFMTNLSLFNDFDDQGDKKNVSVMTISSMIAPFVEVDFEGS